MRDTNLPFSRWILVTAAVLGPLSGCSVITDSDRVQCSVTADCTSRGPDFAGTECVESVCQRLTPVDPKWGCLNEPPPEIGDGPFTVTFSTSNILTQVPLDNADVKLCRKIDVNCDDPELETTTDGNGAVTMQVTAGFAGYVTFEKPSLIGTEDEITPGVYVFNPDVNSDMEIAVQIATPGIITALSASAGALQLPDRGVLLLNAVDCQGAQAEGVIFSAEGQDADARVFYTTDGLPDTEATSTDESGFGGFINIAEGTVNVSASVEETGLLIDNTSLIMRMGGITYGQLVPIGQ